jgi:hypothetical protein
LCTVFREEPGFAFVFIAIRLQVAFQANQATFMQIFLADQTRAAPSLDIHPFGIFLDGAFLGLPTLANSQAERGNFFPVGVKRNSGSLPRRPINCTRLRAGLLYHPF